MAATSKKVAKREVQCDKCGYKFESREAKPQCGQCRSWDVKEAWKPEKKMPQEDEEVSKRVEYKGPLTTHLSGQELALAEILINAGLAKNFPDLIKKSLRVTAATANLSPLLGGPLLGGGIMQNIEQKEPEDPDQVMDEMQAREIREMQLEKMREKLKRGESLDSREFMEMVKTREALKMLKNMDKKEGGDSFDKLIQLQMLQSLNPQNRSNDGNEQLLQQIRDLQSQLREQKQEAKMQEMINRFESKLSTSKSGSEDMKTLKDFMLEIEKIREGSRTELEKEKQATQSEIEKRKQLELDHKLKETERKIQDIAERSQGKKGITKSDITEIRETITSAKELAKELGEEGKKGKDAGEIITDIVSKTIDNLTPIAQRYMEDRAQRQPQQPIITQPIQPTILTPQTNPEFESEIVGTPEEEIANMMHQQQKEKK